MVNGKSFFGKYGAVAIKNLPSEIIDKIQVSDTKTKEEQLTGQGASSDKKSINITIQEDKNKGLFGKFTGGSYLWQFKGNSVNGAPTADHLKVFPIPDRARTSNPTLVPNPGY